ncbi:MAG TPA: DUF1631 family protein [Casimicrobiaceae bacterium]|nr:DUF1631 family protein [Casimicrobiaceae bacterium]
MSTLSPAPLAFDAPAVEEHHFTPEEAQALLQACYTQYSLKLHDIVRASLEMAGDLFESVSHIPDGEIEAFRNKRGEWLQRFTRTLDELFAKRLAGHKRRGRRLDADASAATLKVLTAFDHEKQAALTASTNFLRRFVSKEIAALDLRVEILLTERNVREIDNPFAPDYILDAIGSTSRAVFPNPRIWRPVMERLLTDLTPAINKIYISLNRYLADRHVLPEIKAALRARSEWRPADDTDLLPAFSRMLSEVGEAVPEVVVPESLGVPGAPPALQFLEHPIGPAGGPPTPDPLARPAAAAQAAGSPPVAHMPAAPPPFVPTPDILAGLATLARLGAQPMGAPAAHAPGEFPDLDPMMALGTSTPLFATLGTWQRLDLRSALAEHMPQTGGDAAIVPLNLIPHIRTAVADQIANPTDRITMDVIALLFDYVFRDPSIPDTLRSLFGRLQVPILKAALLDRGFFSDKKHAARRVLDHLAEAAVGASGDEAYHQAFTAAATLIIDEVSRDFEIDMAVFEQADAKLARFIEQERRTTEEALAEDVDAALSAEESDKDHAEVLAQIRDKLAGLSVPFDVRSFAETVWADYVTSLVEKDGVQAESVQAALRTLDDMLWSIVAKDRTAQKARLTKMIPALIGALRRGAQALQVPAERAKAFFDELYQLHIAAIKPKDAEAGANAGAEGPVTRPLPVANVHDYVSEMVPGTWLQFKTDKGPINARLTWISPLRTKYIFTSRSRSRAFMYTPEDLAYQLGAGRAMLIVEPVPLFDRAVSAALDTLAASRTRSGATQPAGA